MNENRHSVLVANGWTYEPVSDMYTPPGGGTKRYNREAAWDEHMRAIADTRTPKDFADPRRSRPQ